MAEKRPFSIVGGKEEIISGEKPALVAEGDELENLLNRIRAAKSPSVFVIYEVGEGGEESKTDKAGEYKIDSIPDNFLFQLGAIKMASKISDAMLKDSVGEE